MNGAENMTPPPRPQTPGIAIASLVCGILGFVCFGPVGSIPAIICGHIAKTRIKTSGGALTGDGMALAGLIMGYVGLGLFILIIPLMVAIAIPNFVKARTTAQKNACINNLRQIDGAKQQWALANKKTADDEPIGSDLNEYLGRGATAGFQSLQCPAGGHYTIKTVSESPTCSIPEHELPPL